MELSSEQIAMIIEAAGAAPSIHNTQPWHFTARPDGVIELHGQIDRALWVSDPQARALYQSCGAALVNVRLGIRMTGHDPVVELLPHPENPITALAIIRAEPGESPTATERRLHDAIWRRRTNRGPFAERAVPESVQIDLLRAANQEHAALRWLQPQEAAAVLAQAARAGRALANDTEHEGELRRWIGTGSSQDGIPAGALPARPDSRPAPVRDEDFLAATGDNDGPTATYESSPQLAVLTTESDEPEDWLRAGQALQLVLLTATMNGIAASFLCQSIELMEMREDAAPPWPLPKNLQMIIRFGYGSPTAATPRRPVSEVLRRAGQPRERGALLEPSPRSR
jgi:nitroreductase